MVKFGVDDYGLLTRDASLLFISDGFKKRAKLESGTVLRFRYIII